MTSCKIYTRQAYQDGLQSMIDRGKRFVLGVSVNVIDYDGAVSRIISVARNRKPLGVSALAVHGVMTGALNREHAFRLNSLDIVTPDGQPVRWALRILHGEKLPDRVYGPELTLRLCQAAEHEELSVYFYGSTSNVLVNLVNRLTKRFTNLKIAGYEPSKFRRLSVNEVSELSKRIKASGANIVFVGLGCPKQEVFIFENMQQIGLPLIAVGAAFDFHAGLLSQAPEKMQNYGLEWLYRLMQEPKRLWKRYLILNPKYCYFVLLQFIGFEPSRFKITVKPKNNERFG